MKTGTTSSQAQEVCCSHLITDAPTQYEGNQAGIELKLSPMIVDEFNP